MELQRQALQHYCQKYNKPTDTIYAREELLDLLQEYVDLEYPHLIPYDTNRSLDAKRCLSEHFKKYSYVYEYQISKQFGVRFKNEEDALLFKLIF